MMSLVRSAVVMLYPRTEGLPGAEDCDLDAFLERFRDETSLLVWSGVLAGAALVHVSPLFTVGIPLPAFVLSPETADRHADRIANSPIYLVRQAVFLVKLVAGLAWGAHPLVRAKFALPPYPEDPGTWRTS